MKYSYFAIVVGVAAMCAPVAANAGVHRHHKPHRVAYRRSVRESYGMSEPGANLDNVFWSSGNAAADGNNANSMFGSNSAPRNPG